jgi:hypothetical protein
VKESETVAKSYGAIKCGADAVDALGSVASYFSRNEPSNPALLLVRQALQLTGKSFLEVMLTLVPNTFREGDDQYRPGTDFQAAGQSAVELRDRGGPAGCGRRVRDAHALDPG